MCLQEAGGGMMVQTGLEGAGEEGEARGAHR